MVRSIAAAVALAATSVLAAPRWSPVGPAMQHQTIVASGLDFDDVTTAPIVAYGFTDDATGATRITFRKWNTTSGQWAVLATHEPQFAQSYDSFAFRERANVLYLGLRINEDYILSSILRGGAGYDGFEGCWAFSGWTWDFEMMETGDVRLISSPTNSSVTVSAYGRKGWDQYPASDAWAPFTPVTAPVDPPTLDEIVLTRGGQGMLYTVYSEAGLSRVGRTTLDNTTIWQDLGASFPGVGADIAWAPQGGATLCTAAVVDGCASVHCLTATSPRWSDFGCALKGVQASTGAGVAIVPSGRAGQVASVVVAAVDAATPSILRTASCNATACSWEESSGIASPFPINEFAFKAPEWWEPGVANSTAVPAYAVVSYGDERDTTKDGLAVFAWA